MEINKITPAMQNELRKLDGGSRKADSMQAAAGGGAVDRSEFSADGKKQREIKGEMQIISSMVDAQPDVRTDKVAAARARVSMGFYNTESFAEKLAAKLAANLV
ncbi:MAG: flagellar biosynthesis anti-sigma factor FlgM [Chitinispirillales bacterium]|jgi:anti-sigma28 factor (negative regulator of flagellin synthesis)|nr:flagellar biosynthesis anti-sigma factor FlgM [Chitinispirillales bacterium]